MNIPENYVEMIYAVKMDYDGRDEASGIGSVLIPAKGCINRAKELDSLGNGGLHDSKGRGSVYGGHGVTIVWPSGRSRSVVSK